MIDPISNQLPSSFAPDSRVWIYQSDRSFSEEEATQIQSKLGEFSVNWKSHGKSVKGYGRLFYHQFVILMADETFTDVSGCSTDSSVHLVKGLEKEYGVSFLNRTLLAFLINDRVRLMTQSTLRESMERKILSADTLFFNNLASTKAELESSWLIPVNQSWLNDRIKWSEVLQ